MIKVEVSITPIREADIGQATIVIWQKRHGDWEVKSSIDVIPGQPLAKRTLLVDTDEQIVISGDVKQEMFYDKVQNMVRPRGPHDR